MTGYQRQVIVWAVVGMICGAILGSTERTLIPDLGPTFGRYGDAVVVALVWLVIGGVVGGIVASREVDETSFWSVVRSIIQTIIVAILWSMVLVVAWMGLAVFFSLFLSGQVFAVVIPASQWAVGAVGLGALLWGGTVLARRRTR